MVRVRASLRAIRDRFQTQQSPRRLCSTTLGMGSPDHGEPAAPPETRGDQPLLEPITSPLDPYRYQTGFGNYFNSEAIPGVIPAAQNTPQKCRYELYPEQLNCTSFISPQKNTQHVWFYRILPSVVQGSLKKSESSSDIESSFLPGNKNVHFVPNGLCWQPFPKPSKVHQVDFVQGLKTIAGNGDATTKEGFAIHVYACNAPMRARAFCSHDGDMLILPQSGRLDIQTELGRIMVSPGELVVIQAAIKFKISLPDGHSNGYVQEIFGSHYELPNMGPIGANGMALVRNFEYPVAAFDEDLSSWEIIVKLAGNLWTSSQNHTPFDVVAWHGNAVPFKYALAKFISTSVVDRDQSDPSVNTVLTARSKVPHTAISELMVFTPRWSVSSNTFRPPYYHRNMATEIMGIIYGSYAGSSRNLQPGGLSYQPSFTSHGETYATYKEASTRELKPERVGEGSLLFMFHIPTHVGLTTYALERSGVLEEVCPSLFKSMQPHFLENIKEVNADLERSGLPRLGSTLC